MSLLSSSVIPAGPSASLTTATDGQTSGSNYPDSATLSNSFASPRSGTDAETTTGFARPPILSFPSLHLGSFNTLAADAFPSPPNSAKPSTEGTSPGRPSEDWFRSTTGANGGSGSVGIATGRGGDGSLRPLQPGEPRRESRDSDLSPTNHFPSPTSSQPVRSRESSRSSIRSRGHIPPPLPPPNICLPPLPSLSPISPLAALSPTGSVFGGNVNGASPYINNSNMLATSSNTHTLLPVGSRDLGPSISPGRQVGANLTINIPPASHFTESDKTGSGSSAVLKASPGIPRRRTLVEAKRDDRVAEVRLSKVLDAMDTTGMPQAAEPADSRGQMMFPMPRVPSQTYRPLSPSDTTYRLEKKGSSNNLRASPDSPTAKRTLPRPPASTSTETPSRPLQIQTSVPPEPSAGITPRAVKQTVATLRASSVLNPPPQPQPTQNTMTRQMNPAFALPIIPGLADNGPYPSSRPNSIKGQQATLGRTQQSRPVQEEVCLECMMRDRDLADVEVIGDHNWERASDAAWDDLKRREGDFLRSVPAGMAGSVLSSAHTKTSDGSDDESLSASPPSTAHSTDDVENRRRAAVRRHRAEGKAKRKEVDGRLVREVGWRGFKWEEGAAGEGLPKAFRGTRGGPLSEDGIKAVMTKFPSASAHRYNTLQIYLRHQYMLVTEIAAEAKRVGHYAAPVEMIFASTTSHEPFMPSLPTAAASRTSSLAWDHPVSSGRPSTEQPRPYANTGVMGTAPLSLVRPSPSSPADLTTASTRAPRAVPLQRPTTQFIPDREPNTSAARQRQNLSIQTGAGYTGGAGLRPGQISSGSMNGRGGRWGDAQRDEELWPPISPAESGMRPFSFAVRAGAVAGDRGSDTGHGGRRSIFGRWGGSVTSFFGGSQGGSGSMMDMHLGLDSDRRNQASSQFVHNQPRAVSLASPTRPSFFSRDSQSSTRDNRATIAERSARSMSNSRLSQMLKSDEEEYARTGADAAQAGSKKEEKKGLKGLFRKMKPKSRKSMNTLGQAGSATTYRPSQQEIDQYTRQQAQVMHRHPQPEQQRQGRLPADYATNQLQPPPPLSYLVGGGRGGDNQHNRNRSGSSSSMLTENSGSLSGPGVRRDSAAGLRSVSAPFAGSSSGGGTPNTSPTSSRFDKYGMGMGAGGRRESHASLSGRRGSGFDNGSGRNSIVEVLSGQAGPQQPQTQQGPTYSQRQGQVPGQSTQDRYDSANGSHAAPPQTHRRPHNKTTSSLSASSGVVETPPPLHVNTVGAYFPSTPGQAPSKGPTDPNGHVRAPSNQLSPNRFKNLPPLPPPGESGPPAHQHPNSQREQDDYGAPRASFDPAPLGRQRDGYGAYDYPSPRLAQSMYAQSTGAASASSLGLGGFAPSRSGPGTQQHGSPQFQYQQYRPGDTFGNGQNQGRQAGYAGADGGGGQWGYRPNQFNGNSVDLGESPRGYDARAGGSTVGKRGLKGLFSGKAGRLA